MVHTLYYTATSTLEAMNLSMMRLKSPRLRSPRGSRVQDSKLFCKSPASGLLRRGAGHCSDLVSLVNVKHPSNAKDGPPFLQ